jgi:hypothetical protein
VSPAWQKAPRHVPAIGQSFEVEQEKLLSGEQLPNWIAHGVTASQNAWVPLQVPGAGHSLAAEHDCAGAVLHVLLHGTKLHEHSGSPG